MTEQTKFTIDTNHDDFINDPIQNDTKRSRFYLFCKKCHSEDENIPSWQPPHWNTYFPYPYCPSYRQFAQNAALFLTVLLLWCIVYGISPNFASTGGQLFSFTILTLASYIGGLLLLKLTTLPALIGMLLVGILLQNINCVNIEGSFSKVTSELRKIALVIILTRAGLSLDPPTLKKLFVMVLKLGLIPWIAECIAVAVFAHYFLNLPWDWAYLLSCIIASVSPAVVVPCFIRLRSKGYGVAKGIPTIVLAAATIDDTTSIAVYGVISSIMFTESSLTNTLSQGPISLIGGVAFGVIWGFFVGYVPERNDSYVAQLRVVLLFLGSYFSVTASNLIGYAGAGPLAVISAAFIANWKWSKQDWTTNDNPVVTAFRVSWVIFEPILFGLTGTQVKLNLLDPKTVVIGTGCLFGSVAIRIFVTILVCYGNDFNFKEKIFIGLSWMAKATVQAALGPLAIDSVTKMNGSKDELQYAETLLMICILSIVLTAPVGAILISITGPRLLFRSLPDRKNSILQADMETNDENGASEIESK